MKRFCLPLFFGFLSFFAMPTWAQDTEPVSDDLVFILDGSGSMWRELSGEHMIVSARKVLGTLIDELPANKEVGLIVYGHRREGDCSDIEVVAPLAPLDAPLLKSQINEINPTGKTPITASMNEAFDLIKDRDGKAAVILVSDGLETCGGDPCALVREAKGKGVDFVMHVIGYGIEEDNVAQLECAAQAGGGTYFSADNTDQLAASLEKAVDTESLEGSAYLMVTGIADNELADVAVRITTADEDADVAGGRTYRDEATNPRLFALEAGSYTVRVTGIGFDGDVRRMYEDIAVVSGDTTKLVADYSTGEISVKVTRNGELSDAVISIDVAETGKNVAGGRSYTSESSNPSIDRVTSGVYTIEVTAIEIKNKPEVVIENVKVSPGGLVEHEIEFESGTLMIGAVDGDELIDATVNVKNETGGVAGGRTYTAETSNPNTYELLPGTYQVTVKALKRDGDATREFEVEVKQGETTRRIVDFGQ